MDVIPACEIKSVNLRLRKVVELLSALHKLLHGSLYGPDMLFYCVFDAFQL